MLKSKGAEVLGGSGVLEGQAGGRLSGAPLGRSRSGHGMQRKRWVCQRSAALRPGTLRAVHRIEIKTHLGRGDVTAVRELLDAATAADAHAALDEHAWLDLVQGGREGFAGLVAWEDGHDHPVGYAQVSRGGGQLGARVRRRPTPPGTR